MSSRILIVDDEANYRRVLRMMLADVSAGGTPVDVVECGDGAAALALLDETPVDLIITDVNMPKMTGLELLHTLRERNHQAPVVVITAHSSIDDAVDAMRRGALDYLTKPFDADRLVLTVERALRMAALMRENDRLRGDAETRHGMTAIKGSSDAITQACRLAGKMAQADSPVLITGESGTGKELFARAIHLHSKRRQGPFVAINCAAIPEGLLEAELFGAEAGAYTGAAKKRAGRIDSARGGTLFLDEIGDMPMVLQAKLLRLLQERTYSALGSDREQVADVRFVCATHRDVQKLVAEGRFREDLRFRISVLVLALPPLRARGQDIIELAEITAARVCSDMGKRAVSLSDAARAALQSHTWPGNVRELSNVVERAIILSEGSVLDVADLDLPTALPQANAIPAASGPTAAAPDSWTLPDGGLSLDALERTLVEQALLRTKGNKTQAARLLGLTRATLRYRIEKMGLAGDTANEDS